MKFTSAAFDKVSGVLYTGCHSMKVWEARSDPNVEIQALQVDTLSKQILKERKMPDLNKSLDNASAMENKNGRILVTKTSELVDVLVNETDD
jgi:hypothetical protein